MSAKYRGGNGKRGKWYNATGVPIAPDDVIVLKTGAAGEIGVADGLIPDASLGTVWRSGTFELPKKSGDTPAIGDPIYWDSVNAYFTTTTSNTYGGRCAPNSSGKAPAGSDATIFVDINFRSAA